MSNLVPLPSRLPIMTHADIHGANCDLVVAAHLRWLVLAGLSPGTIDARRRALLRLQIALGKPLLEASAADLAAWREHLDVAPDTVGDYVSHARQFFAWAMACGLAEATPVTPQLPVPVRTRRLPRPIGEQDLLAAVAGAPDRIRPWLVLAGWAGLRAKEIALLSRERVLDTARPPVLLVAYDATKGRSERVVPLSSFVLAELQLPGSGWVFRRVDGGRGPNSPARVSQLANRYLHEAGIRESLHQLRHRFGTVLYAQTHDLRLVQEVMGHRRPETTSGYTKYDNINAAAAVELLPAPGQLRAVSE